MKHTIIVLAALQAVSAHALVMKAPAPVINGAHRLPGVPVPVVTIKPTMLPTVKLPVLGPNQGVNLSLAKSPVAQEAPIMLPGLFNPNSPVSFPSAGNERSDGKAAAKLSALFDGAGNNETPAVPVGEGKTQQAPAGGKEELPALQVRKGEGHVTLPENDLLNEIGF